MRKPDWPILHKKNIFRESLYIIKESFKSASFPLTHFALKSMHHKQITKKYPTSANTRNYSHLGPNTV